MKIIGAMMIIGASAWLGSLIANNYRQRPRILGRFVQAVEMLRSLISYSYMPLPQAFGKVAQNSSGFVAKVFSSAAELMSSGQGLSGGEAWNQAVTYWGPFLPLDQDDQTLLKDAGNALGMTDRTDQERHLSLALEQIRRRIARLEESASHTAKVWFYLGLSGGGILVLVLL